MFFIEMEYWFLTYDFVWIRSVLKNYTNIKSFFAWYVDKNALIHTFC